MNFGPVFAKLLLVIGIYAGAAGLLRLFYGMDEELRNCSRNCIVRKWLIYSTLVCALHVMEMNVMSPVIWISLWFLGIYFVVASVTDTLICQVYDILQYIGVIGGGIWLWYQNPPADKGIALLVFSLMQYGIFMRMYGNADGMGYCVCSLYLAGAGFGLEGFLYQMLAGFLILTLVQLFCCNINTKGQLKQPIALFPYIIGGFMILWYSK